MKNIKISASTPEAIKKAVIKALKNDTESAKNFETMVNQSVHLGAKNSKNFNSKDLAVLQTCQLAKMYGVTVELK